MRCPVVNPRRRGLPHAVPAPETPKWAHGPLSLPGCHHAAPSYCHKKTPRKGLLCPAPEQGLSIVGSGGRIRTCDLRVMSPTSCQTAPPRTRSADDTKTGEDVSRGNAGDSHRQPPRAPTPGRTIGRPAPAVPPSVQRSSPPGAQRSGTCTGPARSASGRSHGSAHQLSTPASASRSSGRSTSRRASSAKRRSLAARARSRVWASTRPVPHSIPVNSSGLGRSTAIST